MKSNSLLKIITILMICLIVSTGCLEEVRSSTACRIPENIQPSDVTGTWETTYDNFISPYSDFVPDSQRISGVEKIILLADGTYTQSFQSPTYNYEHTGNRWELRDHPSEGYKLVLDDFVYFAHGLKLAQGPLRLFPQSADLNRYQLLSLQNGIRSEHLTIDYPSDGFVYLYPRVCLHKLRLLQMTAFRGDPDVITPENPMFSKVK